MSSNIATPDSDLGVGIQLVLVQNESVVLEDGEFDFAEALLKKRVRPIPLNTVDKIKTEVNQYDSSICKPTEVMPNQSSEHQ